MSVDFELESWRREWHIDTELLPELRASIRGQNRRMLAGMALVLACLAVATFLGVREPGSGWGGFALGAWIAAVLAGGYTLWVRRGTWEPAGATTEAYVRLLHRRAVATLKKTVVLGYAMVAVFAAYAGWSVLSGTHRSNVSGLVFTGFTVALLLMGVLQRRRRRAVAEAARLLELLSEAPEPPGAQGPHVG